MRFFDRHMPQRMSQKLRALAYEFGGELRHHATGHYPRFVHASRPRIEGEIPIFVYHSIDPEEFAAHLHFLKNNGYRTITCDTYVAALRGDIGMPEKAVLLTIDDGRVSVYQHAFPLLKSFEMTAAVFLIPGYMQETSDEVGRADPDLMTWSEVAEIAGSGCMEFQSHTHFHHRVPVDETIIGFVSPATASAPFDIPVATGHEPASPVRRRAFYGYPIFSADSRMSGRAAFLPERGLINALRAAGLADCDGFFRRTDWQSAMHAIVEDWRARHGRIGRFESPEETAQAISDALSASRDAIAQRLPNQTAWHLCLPYTLGSELAVSIARALGYQSCFWGVRTDRRSNGAGDDPMYSVRLKGDFLPRLPGRQRKSMTSIVTSKIGRRLSGRPVY